MSALLTCGHTRASLATVRSLGRAGLAVAVGSPTYPNCLAQWSRYASATLPLPDPAKDARNFAHTVGQEADGRRSSLILPTTDAALWALSRFRSELPECAAGTVERVLPSHEALVRVLDRGALHDFARSLGVPCTETRQIHKQSDVEPTIRWAEKMGLPALVRPLVSWTEREDGSRVVASSVAVSSVAELRQLLYSREDLIEPGCLVEPRPLGQIFGYGVVCSHEKPGMPIAEVFQERLREQGVFTGVSTMARTVVPDAAMRAIALPLLSSMNWRGPAFFELLRLPNGKMCLVNMLGRFWGSGQLAIHAGVDVPLLLWQQAKGITVNHHADRPVVAQAGVLWRWGIGDIQEATSRTWHRLRTLLSVSSILSGPRLVGPSVAVSELLRAKADIADLDDPTPFILELKQALVGKAA